MGSNEKVTVKITFLWRYDRAARV